MSDEHYTPANTPATGPVWERAILHVDMDAFFASIEQLDHPEWRGLPVIVGGSADRRGVVSTASYEARLFGVHSAMPSARAARLCPTAVWAHPRFDRYHELSEAVCDIFRSVTPHVQQVSIDEAYLDVTPSTLRPIDPVSVAHDIQTRVDALGLSCSIGVAETKTVAKIASDHRKPHGITVVPPGTAAEFLAPLPVRAIPGVGGATAERLRLAGIVTLGELAALDEIDARQLLGSSGTGLVERAHGIDDRPVRSGDGVKSVSNEHTFSVDVRTRSDVEGAVRLLVCKVASRLRSKRLKARTFTLKLRYADFTTKTVSRTVKTATDLDADMMPVAFALLGQVWSAGAGLRLIGFGASGFAEGVAQLDLLDDGAGETHERSRALTESLDAVRARFGDAAIGFGHTSDERDPHVKE